MPNGQCVIVALLRTKPATFSIPEEVVLPEVRSLNVDETWETNAGALRPEKLPSMCHLSSKMALSKRNLAFSRLLTKVTPHGPPPRLRQHRSILDLPASRTCWIKTGSRPAIITLAYTTNISITCTHVSYLANIWTRCLKTLRTIRASSCFYQ